MSLFMILRIGIKALGRNKMRTGLTMLAWPSTLTAAAATMRTRSIS